MAEPQRIASLLSSATEMLYALGLGERVVAISHECDFPADVLRKPRVTRCHIDDRRPGQLIDQQVQQLLQSGAALYSVDESLLTRLAPDLIVTQAQCDVCAVRYQDVVRIVQSLPPLAGAEIVALNPTSLREIIADIQRVADAAGAAAAGRELCASLNGRIAAVAERTAQSSLRPRVVCIEWIQPLMLASNWMPQLVELAGGDHTLTIAGQPSAYCDWSRIVQFDPEVLVIMPCGFDLPRTVEESRHLTTCPGFSSLTAVTRGRVFAVDGNAFFNRAGPRIVQSLEILAHLLHPQVSPLPVSAASGQDSVRRLQLHGDVLEAVPVQ